jgi:hypothetical protein
VDSVIDGIALRCLPVVLGSLFVVFMSAPRHKNSFSLGVGYQNHS